MTRTGGLLILIMVLSLAGAAAGQELDSSNREALAAYQAGVALVKSRDWTGAAGQFATAVRHDPEFSRAHFMLGLARGNLRQYTEAAACFERALAIKPRDFDAQLGLAQALLGAGLREKAEAAGKEALAIDEDRHEAHYFMGQLYLDTDRIEDAVKAFGRSVALMPANPRYQERYATALARVGRFADATDALREAVRRAPKDAQLRRELGVLFFAESRYFDALSQFMAAFADPRQRDHDLFVYLMRSTYEIGVYPDSLQWAMNAERVKPNDSGVLLFAANLYRTLRQYDAARQMVQRVRAAAPTAWQADFELGMILFDQQKFREAADRFRRVTEAAPAHYESWYHLGLALRKVGQRKEGERALLKFKELKDAEQAGK